MKSDKYELSVLVHGKPVREYEHEGRIYIEGRKGTDYTIRIKNKTHGRILAVISVDGLSIMTGKEGSIQDAGYVLGPKQTLNIPGWALNDNEVAKFRFGQSGEAYAAKMGKPRNIGVVGCAVFTEKFVQPIIGPFTYTVTHDPHVRYGMSHGTGSPLPPLGQNTCGDDPNVVKLSTTNSTYTEDSAKVSEVSCNAVMDSCFVNQVQVEPSGMPSPVTRGARRKAAAPEVKSEIGTEFGKRQTFRVNTINFNRSDAPDQMFEMTYDTREGLERRGVDLRKKPVVGRPDPFPADHCKPPEGWVG